MLTKISVLNQCETRNNLKKVEWKLGVKIHVQCGNKANLML